MRTSVMRGSRARAVLMTAVAVAMLALAGCTGDDPTPTPEPTATPTPSPTPAGTSDTPTPMPTPTNTPAPSPTATPGETATPEPAAATVASESHPDLGDILVDSEGRTLYLFTNDERNASNCSGGCASAWPPLTTSGDPEAGQGVNGDRLGTIERDDGDTQVTYNGWPLYYYADDSAPGDVNGQDVGDVWYVLNPNSGGPVQGSAGVEVAEDSELGPVLSDASGRTLYLYTRDERNASNCSGGCALSWPPLLTIDDPSAGDGVSDDRLGTIERDDGSTQVAYNGWPLYYFANDAAPGDTNGQDAGDVWFVLNPDSGGPVQGSAEVSVSDHSDHGEVLVDASGRSLYLFTNDEPGTSNCSGGCALNWPPLLTVDSPSAGEGAMSDLLDTTERADGTEQVTYNGWPLYYFANDAAPGDASGQGRGDVWYLLDPSGEAVGAAEPTPTPGDGATVASESHSELGDILVDDEGHTLYLFTRDERNDSNCSGGCASAWPPLTTSGEPQAGEGVNGDRLGAIERDDGDTQVTYNGWPLYYYADDAAPGDVNGQDVGDVWYVVNPNSGGPVQGSADVEMAEDSDLGPVLTDASGRTLYLYTRDERNDSNCSGGCALSWPPLLTVDDPAAGDDVSDERMGTIERDDGSTQVTYNGWPLYYFANDAAPGDTNGQDAGDVWFVVSPQSGGPVQGSAGVEVVEDSDLGPVLTDASGRTLYLYTRDERNDSNCSGGCALNWPPLLTVDDPDAGDGVSDDRLGTIERDDGGMQVAYNGWPLYYFANDAAPGDASGQGAGDVWYLLDPSGDGVGMPDASGIEVAREEYPNFNWERLDDVGDAVATTEISLESAEFQPISAVVEAGAEVTFTNNDSFTHTVTIPALDIDRTLSGGESFTVTMDEPGTYGIVCTIHPPDMLGKIVVEE